MKLQGKNIKSVWSFLESKVLFSTDWKMPSLGGGKGKHRKPMSFIRLFSCEELPTAFDQSTS